GFVAALIMPRIPPLSKKPDTYVDGSTELIDESIPEGHHVFSYGYEKAIKRSRKESSLYLFFTQGGENVLDTWMGVSSVVIAGATVALSIAQYAPILQWLGVPLIPI